MEILQADSTKQYISQILLLFSLLICTIFQGGFIWYACIIPSLILLVLIVLNLRKTQFSLYHVLMIVIMLSGAVAIVFTNADKQNALYEYEKILCFILAVSAGGITGKQKISNTTVFISLFTAVIGILSYCNLIQINGYILNDKGILRLQSCLTYSNTTAVLLACGYILSLGKTNKIHNHINSAAILTALYLTLSKGAIMSFIVLGTVLILFKKEYAKQFIVQNILTALTTAIVLYLSQCHAYMASLLTIIIGVFIVANISVKIKDNAKIYYYIWFIFLILCMIGVIIVVSKYRIDILSTFIKRLYYMKDALMLLPNNFLFGIGSGGWQYYQYQIQTNQYSVKYIHNGWLQFLAENGVIFTACLIMIFVSAIYRLYKSKEYALLTSLLLISAHSLIDFDFSYGVILLVSGLIIGTTANFKSNKIYSVSAKVGFIICLAFILYMCAEYCVRFKFESEIDDKNYNAAIKCAHCIEKLCPYDANIRVNIAELDAENAQQYYLKAMKLSPLDSEILAEYINYLLLNQKDGILELCEKYINLRPKQEETYTFVKRMANKAFDKNLCTELKYNNFIKSVETKQNQEGVTDRNKLLDQLIKITK